MRGERKEGSRTKKKKQLLTNANDRVDGRQRRTFVKR